MGTWVRIRALTAGDWAVLAVAAAGLAFARAGLPLVRFAAGSPPETAPSSARLERAHAVARLVGIASRRLPFATTCLHRSLVLWWLLKRRGIPGAIHLGTRTAPEGFAAHAWVECDGVPLGEDPAPLAQYHAFDRTVVPRARFGS